MTYLPHSQEHTGDVWDVVTPGYVDIPSEEQDTPAPSVGDTDEQAEIVIEDDIYGSTEMMGEIATS